MKVRVYYNLHKHCWSVVDVKTGRVCQHTQTLTLKNVRFRVRESGRQKVLKERRKNVHAFVIGELNTDIVLTKNPVRVYYNPYKMKTFRGKPEKRKSKIMNKAEIVTFEGRTVTAWQVEKLWKNAGNYVGTTRLISDSSKNLQQQV